MFLLELLIIKLAAKFIVILCCLDMNLPHLLGMPIFTHTHICAYVHIYVYVYLHLYL